MKNEKGITLIALVITVIIMLILAGVAISALTGDGGLFDKTLKSAEAYENASQKEAKQLDILMNEIDGYIGDLTADKKAPSVAKLEVSNITDTGFTLTATGKDNVGIAKYEFYIKNSDGTFTLEKTIESEDTTVTYDVTGKTMKQNSYTYKLKVYDKAGNTKESSELLIEALDTTAPTVATLVASDVTDTGFTLTATGEDDKGIVKYEFYIKESDGSFKLERTMEVSGNTAVYNVTGKTISGNSYEYKVIVYDKAGNSKESDIIMIGGKKASEVVQIGDYIDYDAGVWTQEDFELIKNSPGNPTVTGKAILGGTVLGQFQGFELGQSRNTNTPGGQTNSEPKTAGWRVWDIDSSTGVVTLIAAGHSESCYLTTNYTTTNPTTQKCVDILKNRDYTMYVNGYATEAHVLTAQEAVEWYNARFETNYVIVENDWGNSTFREKTFTTQEPISVLENGGNYWLATGSGKNSYGAHIFNIVSSRRYVANNVAGIYGIRVLITLKPEVLLGSGDGSVDNPWKLAQM